MARNDGRFAGCLRITAAAFAIAATVVFAAPPAVAQSSIKVVVDDTAITTMDIRGGARLLLVAMRWPPAQSQKTAVDELIDEALRLQDARRRGIVVNEAQVDRAFAGIAERSNMTPEQFANALGQAGVPASSLKARLRSQIAWGQIVRARLRSEMREEQDDLIAQIRRQEKATGEVTAEDFVLQRVVFTLPGNPSPALVTRRRQEAEQLRGRFKNCEEGLALARTIREVAVINVGRKLASEVTPQLYEALKDVKAGSLSAPQVTVQGIEMMAVCERIAVTGESAASSMGIDSEAFSKEGERISAELTRDLRQRANIVYR
jgi:peptidyl-prolyl cis-trans isomerase SurA